jgi:hypothetical protein
MFAGSAILAFGSVDELSPDVNLPGDLLTAGQVLRGSYG